MSIKVLVGVPTEGKTEAESYQNRMTMMFHLGILQERTKHFEFYSATVGRMFVPLARERLAAEAVNREMDYLFMIDDDMLAPANTFELLFQHDVDIVAALAFTRNPPHLPVLYSSEKGWDPIHNREYYKTDWIRNYPKNKLVECDAVGFGCVLIKVPVIKKMTSPYFMSTCGTGEDILFCLRAKDQAGAQVFMDTSTKLGHLGAPLIVDEAISEGVNDPALMERLYGPYKRHGVFNVAHFDPAIPVVTGKETEAVVMAGL